MVFSLLPPETYLLPLFFLFSFILLSTHPYKPYFEAFLQFLTFPDSNKKPNLDDICASSPREDNPVFLKQRSYRSSVIWPKVPCERLA